MVFLDTQNGRVNAHAETEELSEEDGRHGFGDVTRVKESLLDPVELDLTIGTGQTEIVGPGSDRIVDLLFGQRR